MSAGGAETGSQVRNRDLFTEEQAPPYVAKLIAQRVAVLLFSVLPFFFMMGFLILPDAPLTAAWAGTLYFLERAILAERRRAWLGVGVRSRRRSFACFSPFTASKRPHDR